MRSAQRRYVIVSPAAEATNVGRGLRFEDKDLGLEDKDKDLRFKDKDLGLEDKDLLKDKDKDLRSEDKDKDL